MKKRNLFKLAALTAVFALGSMFANAQQTSGNIPRQNEAVLGQDSGYVKVIDNKGTVKYLQSMNGITMLTNLTPQGGIVTTWQLGGTFENDVTLNVDDQQFNILGVDTVQTGGTAPTYQLLVTDPTTGNIRRLTFEGLIKSGVQKFTVAATPVNIYTLTPAVSLPVFSQVYVYRNGAKLLANEDYILSGTGAFEIQSTVTLYTGDVLEIHYIK